MSADKIPISTEARAKVRLWKRQTLARFQRIDAVIASAAFRQASRDFAHKKGKGRLRARQPGSRTLTTAPGPNPHPPGVDKPTWPASLPHGRQSAHRHP
jgi:hypothetical protein